MSTEPRQQEMTLRNYAEAFDGTYHNITKLDDLHTLIIEPRSYFLEQPTREQR